MQKEIKKKKVDEYILETKTDIYVHIVMTVLIFLILLFVSYKVNWYYLLIFDAVFALCIIEKIKTYNNVREIVNSLKDNKLLDMIGKVEYWNEYDYFLTENYMIIIRKHIISCFKYESIRSIKRELRINRGKVKKPDLLHIMLEDDSNHYVIINNNGVMRQEKSIDITNYLIEKNKKIKIEEPSGFFK